jgi:DNA-directed RNA polymerase specialized sigma54-like protein
MAIEPRLTQQTSQKLLLSPQMKLYLQLLTLPVLELKTRIENEMIENPSLEEDLKDTPEGETNDKETSTSEEDAKFDQTVEMLSAEPSEESMNPNPDEIRSTQKKIVNPVSSASSPHLGLAYLCFFHPTAV